MSWDIFRGGQDVWSRSEKAERFTEATMRHARLQRDAYELIDKAWAARTVTADPHCRVDPSAQADRKTIAAFQKEYELGQRSLIDLLNAQNQYFNAAVSLTSARGVIVFADYQLLAAMGTLIEYLKAPPPVDAAPVDLLSFGLPAYALPTLRVNLPQTGSEPLRVSSPGHRSPRGRLCALTPSVPSRPSSPAAEAFQDRRPQAIVGSRRRRREGDRNGSPSKRAAATARRYAQRDLRRHGGERHRMLHGPKEAALAALGLPAIQK